MKWRFGATASDDAGSSAEDMDGSMTTHDRKIWFPAKRYGFGWGLPCAWQGWLVLIVYAFLMLDGVRIVDAKVHPFEYLGYGLFLTLLFLIVCYLKGERPAWHWGKRDRRD